MRENGSKDAADRAKTVSAKLNPWLRVFPSLTDVAFILPIAFLFLRMDGLKYLLGDGDTGWHLRTGEWILQNGRVPDRDLFSFTKAGQPWYAWEWLWDATFAKLYQFGGLTAVIIASIAIICATYAVLYRLMRRKCGNGLLSIAVLVPVMAASSIHWLARPHLVTLLFFAIWYSILERVHDGNRKLLWLLPAITVLWTNLHGGFLAGIVMLLVYAAGEFVTWIVAADAAARRAALGRSKPYLISAAACLAASLINPYSYHLHVHMFRYLTDPFQYEHIVEFMSLSFQHPAAPFFECMLLLGSIAAIWHICHRRFIYPVLMLIWGHAALFSARNIPMYMIAAAPPLAQAIEEILAAAENVSIAAWMKKSVRVFREWAAEFGELDRFGTIPMASALAIGVLTALTLAPNAPAKLRAEYDPKNFPVKAIGVLRGPEFSRGIFTNDSWGGYLIYRLYPQTKVFVDGRSDFYGSEFDKRFMDVMDGNYKWKRILQKYDIRAVLLPVDASLASTLKESSLWRPVYDDGIAIVFRNTAGPIQAAGAVASEALQVSAGNAGGISRGLTTTKQTDSDLQDRASYARR
ncbi:MAG: hypothetical protein ABSG25_13945 [Bryobacteraceae bacterium]